MRSEGIRFALIHQAALAAWGLDRNICLPAVDVLADGVPRHARPTGSGYAVVQPSPDLLIRIWTAASLGLENGFETVKSEKHGCRVLAPELVLQAIDRSPDRAQLGEQTAKLCAVLCHDKLSDREVGAARDLLHLP